MQLVLKKVEIATLVLHMAIMRKNVKKGFKSNYGKQKGEEVLNAYDELKDRLNKELESMDESQSERSIDFSKPNIVVLSSFLDWYVLEVELELADKNINKEDKEQLQILSEIKEKVNGLKKNE